MTNGNYESIRKEWKARDFAGLDWKPNEPNVQCAVLKSFQLRESGHLAHRNLYAGKTLTKSLNEVREASCQRRKTKANAQEAAFAFHCAAGNINRKLRVAKQGTSVLDQDVPCPRKCQLPWPSDK